MAKYIENTNIGNIVCRALDNNGRVVFEKTFCPKHYNAFGEQDSTGFTEVSDSELSFLANCKTFQYCKGKGKLTVLDDLPSELKTPSQTISEMGKEISAKESEIAKKDAEIARLKAELERAALKSQVKPEARGKK